MLSFLQEKRELCCREREKEKTWRYFYDFWECFP